MKHDSALDVLDEQYINAENKTELDYWVPLSNLIIECIELRDAQEMNQTELANVMNTRQSVISRFENLGRKPNYDFIVRLALALRHVPGITLYGDYMATVPLEKQDLIKKEADAMNVSTHRFIQDLLDESIKKIELRHGLRTVQL